MNYSNLKMHGTKYIDHALTNWDMRKGELICAWGRSFDVDDSKTMERIDSIIAELDVRIDNCLKILYDHKYAMIKEKDEYDHSIVLLECPSFKCRYNPDLDSTGVRMKDYTPGDLKCSNCGEALQPKDNFML